MNLGIYSLDWTAIGDAGTRRVLDVLLALHEGSFGRAFLRAVTDDPLLAVALDFGGDRT